MTSLNTKKQWHIKELRAKIKFSCSEFDISKYKEAKCSTFLAKLWSIIKNNKIALPEPQIDIDVDNDIADPCLIWIGPKGTDVSLSFSFNINNTVMCMIYRDFKGHIAGKSIIDPTDQELIDNITWFVSHMRK